MNKFSVVITPLPMDLRLAIVQLSSIPVSAPSLLAYPVSIHGYKHDVAML